MTNDRIMYLLRFWFGRVPDGGIGPWDILKAVVRVPYWYGGKGGYDAELRREFADDARLTGVDSNAARSARVAAPPA